MYSPHQSVTSSSRGKTRRKTSLWLTPIPADLRIGLLIDKQAAGLPRRPAQIGEKQSLCEGFIHSLPGNSISMCAGKQ